MTAITEMMDTFLNQQKVNQERMKQQYEERLKKEKKLNTQLSHEIHSLIQQLRIKEQRPPSPESTQRFSINLQKVHINSDPYRSMPTNVSTEHREPFKSRNMNNLHSQSNCERHYHSNYNDFDMGKPMKHNRS